MAKAVKITLIVIASMLVAVAGILALAFTRQTRRVEASFCNPIIDSHYQDWEVVDLDDNIEIKLPQTWKLERVGDRIHILNDAGEQVAIGAKLPCLSEEAEDAFLSDILGGTLKEFRLLWTSGLIYNNMTSVSAAKLTSDVGASKTYVYVNLPYLSDYRYFFCFPTDEDGTLFSDEAEAIAYSMSRNI